MGSLHSWELVTAVDGPGTRLTFFLAGCALRCQYCQNPDTWKITYGRPTDISEVTARIDRYARVLKAAGGGVTVSGGEPMLQLAFLRRILQYCKQIGLHTAVDTSGYLGARADDSFLDLVDLFLLDIKSGIAETYKKVTERELQPTLDFSQRLALRQKKIWIRFVLVPDLTDAVENVEAVADHVVRIQELSGGVSVERVEVLPFHQMGRSKWDELGMSYPLEDAQPPSVELVERVRNQFRARGLKVY